MYTFSSIGDQSIPKSVECTHSATKVYRAEGFGLRGLCTSLSTAVLCSSQVGGMTLTEVMDRPCLEMKHISCCGLGFRARGGGGGGGLPYYSYRILVGLLEVPGLQCKVSRLNGLTS